MNETKTEKRQNIPRRESENTIPSESKVQLLFLGLLSIGFVGYFAMRESWIGFIFAHTAAISIMGFFGCLAGAIAQKKGFRYRKAFQIGFFLPIILGGISAFLFVPAGRGNLPLTCGGWVSLATGIFVVGAYFMIKKSNHREQIV